VNVKELVELDYTGDWRKFANLMFELEDADPGYMLLARAKMDEAKKLRYILGWCTFYNPGLAARASDFQGAAFYEFLRSIFPTAKRATERRHFRGQAGLKALAQWQSLYPKPEAMVEACFAKSYMGVRKNMQHMAQMGDYFYWKLADIQDTVFHHPVDFTGSAKYMPKLPKQGALIIGDMENSFELEETMSIIDRHIGVLDHPFSPKRKLKLQESETVACVFKQHWNGNYKFSFRSGKAYKRLVSMMDETPTAQVLLNGLYAGGIWNETDLKAVGEYL